MQVFYIPEYRFYPVKDAGKSRNPVSVGDLVSFKFPHRDSHGIGEVVKIYELNGKILHDLVERT